MCAMAKTWVNCPYWVDGNQSIRMLIVTDIRDIDIYILYIYIYYIYIILYIYYTRHIYIIYNIYIIIYIYISTSILNFMLG